MPVSRRTFLKGVAVGAVTAGVAAKPSPARHDPTSKAVEELASEHADDRAMLIDLTRCVGCGRCVTACKMENDLEWREDQPALGPDAALASSNWSIVKSFGRAGVDGESRYTKRQCMQCLEPACASVCFVKALKKTPGGPVTYDPDVCVGCRYCLMACPFGVPTFAWDQTFGRVEKCDFCESRALRGQPTACSEACPTGAITFGRRVELIREAHQRIAARRDRYVDHVYGETEVGGTSVVYISDVPFEDLGFPAGLPNEPLPDYMWEISRLIPPAAASLGATLVGLYLRRMHVLNRAQAEDGTKDATEKEKEAV